MNKSYNETQMLKLNKYARGYIENHDNQINYQKIAKQMKEFSGAEYVMFFIFDEDGKDFTLVGFEGNRSRIEKAMNIIGFNIVGKKFKYKEAIHKKLEESIVTRINTLKEMVGNALPDVTISIIEKIFPIDHIMAVRITKGEKTIGSFNLIFYKNQNKNENEMLELFASQVGLFIDKKRSERKTLESVQRFQALLKNSVSTITIVDHKGNYVDASDSAADLIGIEKEEIIGKNFKEVVPEKTNDFMNTLSTISKTKKPISKEEVFYVNNKKRLYESIVFPIVEKDNKVVLFGSIANDITDRKEAEEELVQSHNLIEYILKHNTSGVAVHNRNMEYMYVSKRYLKSYKVEDKDIIGKNNYEVFPDLPQKWRDAHQRSLQGEVVSKDEDIFYREDGSVDWTRWETRPWYEKDGSIGGIIVYTEIINEEKELEAQIYNEREQFKTTLLSVGDAIIATDKNGKIALMNKVAEDLTKWSLVEAIGRPLEEVLVIINEHTREPCENPARKALELEKSVEMANHTILITKDGQEIPIEDSATPIRDRDGNITGVVIVFRDFTEKRDIQRQIEYLSYHDHLTGLYNRRYMEKVVNELDNNNNLPLSLIIVDVNGLKLTNDAYGHVMGDKLLIKVGDILKGSCREEDVVCRAGGDEFVIILPSTTKEKANEITDKITSTSQNTTLESVIVSLAIGNATKKTEVEDIFEVFKEADNKMYKNKIKYGKTMRSRTIEKVLIDINNKYDQEQIHTERVSQYCASIARALNYSEKEIENVKLAGSLHDIGKIVISPELLKKQQKLTIEECEEIKKHPITSYQLLRSVDEFTHLAEPVLYHHERLDGTGYPEGLMGEEIPFLSKIITVADAYEAMTAKRPYQEIKMKEEAIQELMRCSGTQFDPKIVSIFIKEVLLKEE